MVSAASLLRKYNKSTDATFFSLLEEDIPAVSTIEESEPYRLLIDAILGRTSRISARFPFDTFAPFDCAKISHDCTITFIEKRIADFDQIVGTYASALSAEELGERLRELSSYRDILVTAARFLGELTEPVQTVSELITTVQRALIVPAQSVAHQLGIESTLEGVLSRVKLGELHTRAQELEQEGLLKLRGKPPVKVELWSSPTCLGVVEYLLKLFDSFRDVADVPKGTTIDIAITSTARPHDGAHGVYSGAGSNARHNAADCNVIVKTEKDGWRRSVEWTKRFFAYLLCYWNGGLGIDTSEDNLHIHADLRGHYEVFTNGINAFAERGGKTVEGSSVWKGSVAGEAPRPLADVEALYAAATGEKLGAYISTYLIGAHAELEVGTPPRSDAIAVATSVANALKEIGKLFAGAHAQVFRSVFAGCHALHSIDLRNSVERLVVQEKPGISTYIPLEGSPDPVVQSTGGRTVSVTLSIKTDDPAVLASLLGMFAFDELTEMRFGMLFLNHVLSKRRTGNRGRFKYLQGYYRTETLRNILAHFSTYVPFTRNEAEMIANALSESSSRVRFTEPVHIQNDILNALGMATFIPTQAHVQTLDEAAGVFGITLAFQYVNYGMRSMEDLRIARRGNTPILPMCFRVDALASEEERERVGVQNVVRLGQLSVSLALSEFLPVYALYRFLQFTKTLREMSENGAVDLRSPSVRLTLMSRSTLPTYEEWENVQFPHAGALNALAALLEKRGDADSLTTAASTLNDIAFSSASGYMYAALCENPTKPTVDLTTLMAHAFYDMLFDALEAFRSGYQGLSSFVNHVCRSVTHEYPQVTPTRSSSGVIGNILFAIPLTLVTKSGGNAECREFALTLKTGLTHWDVATMKTGVKRSTDKVKRALDAARESNAAHECAELILFFQLSKIIATFISFTRRTLSDDRGFLENLFRHATRLSLSPVLCNHIGETIVSLLSGAFIDVNAHALVDAQQTLSSRNVNELVIGKLNLALSGAKHSLCEAGIDTRVEVVSGLFSDGLLKKEGAHFFTIMQMLVWYATLNAVGGKYNHLFRAILQGFDSDTSIEILRAVGIVLVVVAGAIVLFAAVALLLEVVAAALAATVLGGAFKLLWFLYSLYETIVNFIPLLVEVGVGVVLSYSNITTISLWLKEEMLSGVSSGQALEMCRIGCAWMPSALEFGTEIVDYSESTYMDYPLVTTADGRPLPPDFFIYKLGLLRDGYNELLSNMNAITEEASVYSKRVGNSPETLMSEFLRSIGDISGSVIDSLSVSIRSYLQGALNAPGVKITSASIATIDKVINSVLPATTKTDIIRFSGTVDGKQIPVSRKRDWAISCNVTIANGEVQTHCTINAERATIVKAALGKVAQAEASFQAILFKAGLSTTDAALAELASAIGTQAAKAVVEYVHTRSLKESMTSEEYSFTLGRLLLVKSLVGSYFDQVGMPGVAQMRNYMQRAGTEALLRAASKRYSYIYPTVKLFIMEEDSEAFYLFDDFYSYSTVLSVSVHSDRESPQQTCILRLSNIYGKLSSTVEDLYRPEEAGDYFLHGATEFAPINAIFLRPGTKIKVMAGYTPILTEDDTIFIGEIVDVRQGAVVEVEARSFGSVLLTTVSDQQIKVYGNEADWTVTRMLKELVRLVPSKGYLYPVHKIRDIISWVLTDLRLVSSRIADYTINPDVSAQIDGELRSTTRDLVAAIKHAVFPSISRTVSEAVGEEIDVSQNNELFENIMISGDDGLTNLRFLFNLDEGSWVSYNETAWDVLQEINLLLPNYILTTRPFATRSTIVWGREDDYYRTSKKVKADSFLTNQVIETLAPVVRDSHEPRLKYISTLIATLASRGNDQVEGALALLSLIGFYSQQIIRTLYASTPSPMRTLLDETVIDLTEGASSAPGNSVRWISLARLTYTPATARSVLRELSNFLSASSSAVEVILGAFPSKSSDALNTAPVDLVTLDELMVSALSDPYVRSIYDTVAARVRGTAKELRVATAAYILSLEHAAQLTLSRFMKIAHTRSTSHRQVAETHVKVSGVDIVHNGLRLVRSPNVVNVEYPDTSLDADEVAVRSTKIQSTGEIPLHYKLSPRAWNVYTTYFKNANVFKSARMSVVAAVASSLLAKLAGGMYQGKIVLLGDPRIKENDIVILWDEINDLYGPVRVKSCTFTFSPEEGCLTTIEPELIAKRTYQLDTSYLDTGFYLIQRVMNIVILGLMVSDVVGGFKKIVPETLLRRLVQGAMKGDVTAAGTAFRMIYGNRIGRWLLKSTESTPVMRFMSMVENTANAEMRTGFMKYIEEIGHARKAIEDIASELGPNKGDILKETFEGAAKLFAANNKEAEARIVIDKLLVQRGVIHEKVQQKLFARDSVLVTHLVDVLQTGNTAGSVRVANEVYEAYRREIIDALLSFGQFTEEKKALDALTKGLEKGGADVYEALADILVGKEGKALSRHVLKKVSGATLAARNASQMKASKLVDEMKKAGLTAKEIEEVLESTANAALNPQPFFLRNIARIGAKFLGYYGARELLNYVWESVDMLCVNTVLADSVVISPLFFRGEPYVAGLDGIEKKEAEKAGLFTILRARFGAISDAIYYGIRDPFVEALLRVAHTERRVEDVTIIEE